MAKLSRIVQKIFGSSGGGSEFGQIGSLAAGSPTYTKDLDTIQSLTQYLSGLFAITNSGAQPPRIQDINALYLLVTSQLKYLFQAGIAEYIATEEYYIGSICQVAGVVYVSQSGTNGTPNTDNDPATDAGTNWLELLDADGLLAKLLTVDGTGSGLDADVVRATTPGTGGLALLALAALGTNWASALGAALATNVKHVMGAGLGADWQTALESAANTAVKSNQAATALSSAALSACGYIDSGTVPGTGGQIYTILFFSGDTFVSGSSGEKSGGTVLPPVSSPHMFYVRKS